MTNPIEEGDTLTQGHIHTALDLWETEQDTRWALSDYLAEIVKLNPEIPRKSIIGKFSYYMGLSYPNVSMRERIGRYWPPKKREKYQDRLKYSHFQAIGDDEELAERAHLSYWTVEDIRAHKKKVRREEG